MRALNRRFSHGKRRSPVGISPSLTTSSTVPTARFGISFRLAKLLGVAVCNRRNAASSRLWDGVSKPDLGAARRWNGNR